jgi:hypothetical protein
MNYFDMFASEETRKHTRDASKWWLDLAHNLIVVALTKYLAHKSRSVFILIFSITTSIAFGVYYVASPGYRAAGVIQILPWGNSTLVQIVAILLAFVIVTTTLW